jgi:hypothetical protein
MPLLKAFEPRFELETHRVYISPERTFFTPCRLLPCPIVITPPVSRATAAALIERVPAHMRDFVYVIGGGKDMPVPPDFGEALTALEQTTGRAEFQSL